MNEQNMHQDADVAVSNQVVEVQAETLRVRTERSAQNAGGAVREGALIAACSVRGFFRGLVRGK